MLDQIPSTWFSIFRREVKEHLDKKRRLKKKSLQKYIPNLFKLIINKKIYRAVQILIAIVKQVIHSYILKKLLVSHSLQINVDQKTRERGR